MPNANVPSGLRPVRHRNGAPYNGASARYFIPASDSTAVFIGDAVKSAGSADADGVATVAQAAAGDTIRGVVVGFQPVTADSPTYRVASTARYAFVADDPDLVFEVQEDAVGGALGADDVGLNADLVVAAGSTITGRSGMQLDSSDKKTGTAQLRILGFAQRADNEIGANAKMLVMINEHELKATTGV
jgi:hypothetical protein